MTLLRALLPDGGSGSSEPATATVGTGEPDQDIPSTAAVVGGVVGGLSGLTLCLAAALVFAVARIYGWRFVRLLGSGSGDASEGGSRRRKQTDVEEALEAQRAPLRLPSIVTSRLERSSSDTDVALAVNGKLAPRTRSAFEPYGAPLQTSRQTSATSTESASPTRTAITATATTPLRRDASWRDCLIEPEKIQILRRRDGKPWVLGGGAFGQVYKALYDGVQVVAAKVLTGLADERILQSFLREASILRDMRDRNIVQFVGICVGAEEEGLPDEAMLIQEFMEAGSLFQALKWRDQAGRRVFGWYARGKRAACDIARGLHYLHSHKVVHLDVKSSNTLLARDGTCKLADVGLARSLKTKTMLTDAGTMGTFAWSAPEVLTGQPCSTPADIYSFGIVLWELVTGEIPSRGTMRNPSVPSECPQEVLDLIDRCTLQDPKERPTAKQIVQLLEGMGEGTPSRAEARGAPLRSASLAVWRDKLPQQVSLLPTSPGSSFGAAPPMAGFGGAGPADPDDPQTMLTAGTADLAAVAELAEQAQQPMQPTPPPDTLKMDELPPLSASDMMFK